MAAIDRLIVMLAAEVAGYARLIRADKKGTLEQLEAYRDQFVYPKIAEHSGRIVRATGDCLLVEFEGPAEAVRCAVELQCGTTNRTVRTSPDRRITFRVGVTAGQVAGKWRTILVSRAVAALPSDTLATLTKPGAEFYGERGNTAMAPCGDWPSRQASAFPAPSRTPFDDQLPYRFEDIGKQEPRRPRRTGSPLCDERGLCGILSAPRRAKTAEPT